MNSDSRLLSLNEVLVGMIVANDLLDTHGGLILGQGTIVTEAILFSLQRRGVETLGIVSGKGVDFDPEVEMEHQRQRLVKLFRRCGNDPTNQLLLRYVTQYRLDGPYE